MRPTATKSPQASPQDSSKDLKHVPVYDATKDLPDDDYEEEGRLRALKKANSLLKKQSSQK